MNYKEPKYNYRQRLAASAQALKKLLNLLPSTLREQVRSKAVNISRSTQLREERIALGWNEASARTVSGEIEELLRRGAAFRIREEQAWTADDREIAEHILTQTKRAGASNITRTAAYLECYDRYPELHWAFLAHMVSRNAGWNMTDLRGGRLADLRNEEEIRNTYRFLERSNALIFQDAYPQLLLYEKSRELGTSQFHLLDYFNVSKFMRPFWERFWIDRCSALLTVGLIINEQNYIEQRIIRHPFYQRHVMDKPSFHLFSLSGLNQIIFPLWTDRECCHSNNYSDDREALINNEDSPFIKIERASYSKDEQTRFSNGKEKKVSDSFANFADREATLTSEKEWAVFDAGATAGNHLGACSPHRHETVNSPSRAASSGSRAESKHEPLVRLAGRTVTDFSSLSARIALGKSLYAMLMGLSAVRRGAEQFARAVPHTGSRADYWPGLFTANKQEALTAPLQAAELLAEQTLPPGQRLYSPKLLEAWGDTPYEPISREDWLKDASALDGISEPQPPLLCDISSEHRMGLLKTALAHDAMDDR